MLTSFCYSQSIPPEFSGTLNVSNGGFVDFSSFDKYITRSNDVSLKLDTLLYYVKSKGKYYVSINVNYYNWGQSGGHEKPEPEYSFATVFEEMVEENYFMKVATGIKLTQNVSLRTINTIEISVDIVRAKDNQSDIDNILSGLLNTVLTSYPQIQIVKDLLMAESDKDNSQLVFHRDFDIPLNSFEYFEKKKDRDSIRLLEAYSPIFIPIKTVVADPKLRPSLLRAGFKLLSASANLVVGKEFDKKNVEFTGMIKLYFTNDDNNNVPDYITNDLRALTFSIKNSGSWKSDFDHNHRKLWRSLDVYQSSDEIDQRVLIGSKAFADLSQVYVDYLLNSASYRNPSIDSGGNGAQSLNDQLKNFYQLLSLYRKEEGIITYAVEGIYSNAYTRIYIPYGLDNTLIKNFISWQIALHQYFRTLDEQWDPGFNFQRFYTVPKNF